jgi:hypothetical protein
VITFDHIRITVTPPKPCPGPPVHNCTDRWHPLTVLVIPLKPVLTVHDLDTVTVQLVPE